MEVSINPDFLTVLKLANVSMLAIAKLGKIQELK